jgi:ATP synthase F1 delta subunit
MASSTIPGVYAAALLGLARDRQTVDAVVASCHKLADALTPAVVRPLNDPRFSRQQAKAAIEALIREEPKEVHDLLLLLVDRNRLEWAGAILNEAIRLYEEEEGIVHVHTTIAAPVDANFQQRMLERIRAHNGAKAVLDLTIDPSLIGGFTSRTGDRYVDASGKRVLAEMRRAMLATPLPDSLWSA